MDSVSAAGHERYPWMDPEPRDEPEDEAWCPRCERFVPFGAEMSCPACGDDEGGEMAAKVSTVEYYVFERGTDETCGEGCGRRALVALDGGPDGGYVYCADCLHHLVQLGSEFADTVSNAGEHLQALKR